MLNGLDYHCSAEPHRVVKRHENKSMVKRHTLFACLHTVDELLSECASRLWFLYFTNLQLDKVQYNTSFKNLCAMNVTLIPLLAAAISLLKQHWILR